MDRTIPWKDEYSVGVAEIDHQHQRLFEIYNRLAEFPANTDNKEMAGEVIEELGNYLDYHFSTEEEYYKRDPVLFQSHKAKHFDFVKELMSLTARYKRAASITDDLACFSCVWLLTHILNDDFAAFARLRKQGLLEAASQA